MTQASEFNPYRLVSSPFEGDFLGLEETLCTRLPAKFLSRFDRADLGPDIVAILDRIGEGEAALNLFRPEFGTIGLAVTKLWDEAPELEWILGQFAIAAYMSGVTDTIDRRFRASRPVCVAGRLLRAAEFHVVGEDERLSVDDGEGRPLARLRREPGPGVPVWREATDERAIAAGTLSQVIRSYGAWADEWGSPDPEPRPDGDPQFPPQVESALRLMEEYAPEYYLWTAALLREVVAKGRAGPDTTTSCSYLHNLGVVELCAPASVLETAEMLVHECSHQHYNLASWWTRMVPEGAPDVYSILKFQPRPLERLLLGFHAFGNALMMYDLLRRRGAPVDPKDLAGRIVYVRSLVDALYLPLIENKQWLSPSGISVYQPLADLLIEHGLIQDEKNMVESGPRIEVTAD